MKKVKNTIPVYDITSLNEPHKAHDEIIAAPFSDYLKVHPNLHTPHRHDFYHIVFFTAGGGNHTIDFEQFAVKPGQIYFMIPGQVHSWNFSGKTNGYVINFSENLLHAFLSNQQYLEQFSFLRGLAGDSVINLAKETSKEITSIFEHIIIELKNHKALNTDMICSQLVALFITVHRAHPGIVSKDTKKQSHVLLSNFRKLIEQNYTEKSLPKDYAAMLYITPNHLNALSKDILGKPAGEVIRDRILLEAKRLLVNAELNIAMISNQLNFTDNSYFTKFFKKYTGATPEEFRKRPTRKINH